MKLLHILGHPVVVITLFCLLLVSGEHFGGVYLLYILLALPHGALHALLAIGGVLLVLSGYQLRSGKRRVLSFVVSVMGLLLMLSSLVVFFGNDKEGYNRATFSQGIPLVSYILFGISMLCYVVILFLSISGGKQRRGTLQAIT
ncbi:MAG TPA: hypothetical protein VGN63_18970 [Flavisolibacter sp.]|jgi:hypothetical protein|nr:hypothetical protein [Flavisolibacter sp.]